MVEVEVQELVELKHSLQMELTLLAINYFNFAITLIIFIIMVIMVILVIILFKYFMVSIQQFLRFQLSRMEPMVSQWPFLRNSSIPAVVLFYGYQMIKDHTLLA